MNNELQTAISEGNTVLAAQKEPEAAARRLKLDNLSNIIALHEAFDTIVYSLDSVRVWWKNMDSPVSEMNLARDYYKHGRHNMAISIIENLPHKYSLSEEALTDLGDFRKIMELMRDESAQKLSIEKIEELLFYAKEGKGISSAWAKNILTVQGYHFPPMPRNPESAGERNGKENEWKPDIKTQMQFLVSPNPASDFVAFKRLANNQTSDVFNIRITDVNGKAVLNSSNTGDGQIIWNTAETGNGLYFYTIYNREGLCQSGRIVVVK